MRFLIERSLPPGALDSLGEEGVKSIVATNKEHDVDWVHSYTNADKTKSFCVYDGPCKDAVLKANAKNGIPFDKITEIADTFTPPASFVAVDSAAVAAD